MLQCYQPYAPTGARRLDDDCTTLRLKDTASVLVIMVILPIFRACSEKLASQATREKRSLLMLIFEEEFAK